MKTPKCECVCVCGMNNGIAQSNDIEIYSVLKWNQQNAFNVTKYVCTVGLAVVARCFGSSIKLSVHTHTNTVNGSGIGDVYWVEWIESEREKAREKKRKRQDNKREEKKTLNLSRR